jgi:hypothetical protein
MVVGSNPNLSIAAQNCFRPDRSEEIEGIEVAQP